MKSVLAIIGLIVVFGAVLGGFAMAGGPFEVLLQPNELVVIGGAAAGTLVISAPAGALRRVVAAFKLGFGDHAPRKQDYMELLSLMYQILMLARREGFLALDAFVTQPDESALLKSHPGITRRHGAVELLINGLKQLVDGCSPDDLMLLFDAELETHHDEEHQPVALIRTMGDSLPGLGIVAAVLGIVVTMAHLNGGPEVIGHHVAAALVGTFLGILLCYGMVGPIATNVEIQNAANTRYLHCIKDVVVAGARGTNPMLAVEFGRRRIFSDERPGSAELEQLFEEKRKEMSGTALAA